MLDREGALLWLSTVNEISTVKKHEIINIMGSPEEIIVAGPEGLVYMGIEKDMANLIFSKEPEMAVAEVTTAMKNADLSFISCENPLYPRAVKEKVRDYPLGFYVLGEMLPLDNEAVISIVGSRRCTAYGATSAYNIAKDLAQKGAVVVSGMADGIDSMAHKGALDGNGITIAILGCGADICYPSANRELMAKIKESGCVISEFPPKTRPSRYTFPRRNRLISGICKVLAVMEADEKSGTLITVGFANEQNIPVFALPGNITSRFSKGTNRLIKQGAGIITCSEDLIKPLELDTENRVENKKNYEKNDISLAPNEKLVYYCIHSEPVTADEVVAESGLNIKEVQYVLTLLELRGLITKLSGQKYIVTR